LRYFIPIALRGYLTLVRGTGGCITFIKVGSMDHFQKYIQRFPSKDGDKGYGGDELVGNAVPHILL
jgi:hypothetical protein